MTQKRIYPDACGLAQALNVLGERWALLVIRELLLGPKRFADLNRDLPGISKPVLSQRLGELEERTILGRRRLEPPAAAWVYELTEWGEELEPVVCALGHWGARSPFFDLDQPLSCTSAAISMRTMFHAEAAAGLDLTVEITLGQERFHTVIRDGLLDLKRAAPEAQRQATATVTTTPEALAGMLYAGTRLEDAEAAGSATFQGDRAAFESFLRCFQLPEPAQKLS